MDLTTPLAILAVVAGFGFLILVHELGHFLVAKWVGIRCTQFAIGFGQSLLTYRPRLGWRVGSTEAEYEQRLKEGASEDELGETEYRLNWVPLGGYVKMLGQEDIGADGESDDPRAYNNKPVWARACVISAGVVMNLIFGLIFFVIAFMAGVQFPASVVGGVDPALPAASTYAQGHEGEPAYRGLKPGDRITHVNGDAVRDFMDVQMATMLGHPETPIRYTVERDGQTLPLHYEMRPLAAGPDNLLSVGMEAGYSLRVWQLVEGGPEHRAGVRLGMRVIAVAGERVETYGQYLSALSQARGRSVAVTFMGEDEDGEPTEVAVEQAARPMLVPGGLEGPSHLAGFVPPTRINDVSENSPAQAAGIEAGDLLARLGDRTWPDTGEVRRIIQRLGRSSVRVAVWRDGRVMELGSVQPERRRIGIVMGRLEGAVVGRTLAGTPAAELDLPPASRITQIAGERVRTWAELQRALQDLAASGDEAVTVAYRLPGEDEQRRGELALDAGQLDTIAHAQWTSPRSLAFFPLRQRVAGTDPIEATVIGVEKTAQFMFRVYQTLLRLVQGTVQVEHLRGPVGIVHAGTDIFDNGFTYFLFFLGLISVNLAVINFLPVPIVDGGHMVFLLIEKVKGSPASPQIQGAATMVGLALILLLFVSVTYHDIARLYQAVTSG
ncbi:MAG: site-2 protease family protein [Phycisphaeraceae bacterium]